MNKLIKQVIFKMANQTINNKDIKNLCEDFNFDFQEVKEAVCFLFLEGFIRNNLNCPFGNHSSSTFRLTLKGLKLLNHYQKHNDFEITDFQESK